jgi:hypothetical protein
MLVPPAFNISSDFWSDSKSALISFSESDAFFSFRMDSRSPERFIGDNVADAGNNILAE